jgi:hypothetical protein
LVGNSIVEFVVPRVKADFLFDPVNNPFHQAGVREYNMPHSYYLNTFD